MKKIGRYLQSTLAIILISSSLSGQIPVMLDIMGQLDGRGLEFTPLGDKVVFVGGFTTLPDLFITDGTPANTKYLHGDYIDPEKLYPYDGKVFFSSDHTFMGWEPWVTDGNSSGTRMVKNLNPAGWDGSHPSHFTEYNGKLYFLASVGWNNNREIYVINGGNSSPTLFMDFNGNYAAHVDTLAVWNDTLYFNVKDTNGYELWKSDGTVQGTKMIKDINRKGDSKARNIVSFDGKIYFTADDGVHGREIWVSNGSRKGTRMLNDLVPGAASSNPRWLTAFEDRLIFTAFDSTTGDELFFSDGTKNGTGILHDINKGPETSWPSSYNVIGNRLVFRAKTNSKGVELWALDKNAAKAVMVKDIYPGKTSSYPSNITKAGLNVYFNAEDDVNGTELWKSNGYTASLVWDIRTGIDPSYPRNLALCNDDLYFQATARTPLGHINDEPFVLKGVCGSFIPQIAQKESNLLTIESAQKYQWFDCSKGVKAINGANSYSYRPEEDGFFKVYVEMNGCKDTSDCFETYAIGVEEFPAPQSLTIVPNPSNGSFTLDLNNQGESNLTVTSLSGQQVYKKRITSIKRDVIDLPMNLKNGLYIVRLQTESEMYSGKLVLIR